jgi:hypothetical protein
VVANLGIGVLSGAAKIALFVCGALEDFGSPEFTWKLRRRPDEQQRIHRRFIRLTEARLQHYTVPYHVGLIAASFGSSYLPAAALQCQALLIDRRTQRPR